MPQMDFNVIADAYRRRFPDEEDQPVSNMLAQRSAEGAGTIPEGQAQEVNQVGGAKSEAQKIVEILGSRLRKL